TQGTRRVDLQAGELAPGVRMATLLSDGAVLATRRLVVAGHWPYTEINRRARSGTPELAQSFQCFTLRIPVLAPAGSTTWIGQSGRACKTRPAAGDTCSEEPTTTRTSARSTMSAASASRGTSSPNHTMWGRSWDPNGQRSPSASDGPLIGRTIRASFVLRA